MKKALVQFGAWALFAGAAAAQPSALPEGVVVETSGAGTYFKTEAGQSLYWNEREVAAGEVTCLDECVETWVPLQAIANSQNQGQWTVTRRPDGVAQWAYQGKPLYSYVKDVFPGAKLGDGLARSWHVQFDPIEVPAGMKIESTLLGRVLADRRGRTLYMRDPSLEPGGRQTPADHWNALVAPWLALDQGDWTIQVTEQGLRQWSYKGQPLYTYDKDIDPQDVHGHRLGGEWSAVILEPAPGLPSWMTIEQVDLGLAYANENGLSIYAPVDINAINAAQTCPEECMRENWRPIYAKAGETSVGDWVILENEEGKQQWSYKGRFVYTHTRDTKPGEMIGNGIAVGYRIGAGWRVILVESGLRPS